MADRGPAVLGVVLAAFVVIHLIRLDRLLVNGDGLNYLAGAMRIADGHLPNPRYSPGLAVLLAPVAAVLEGQPQALRLAANFLNVALAVGALVLVHRFLRAYLSLATSVALVAVFALGETATNVLVGTEVEPVSLLLVVGTLVALQEERTWIAVAASALGAMMRVALAPWFGVLWILRLRRSPRPAGTALGLLAMDVLTYFVLSRQGGYAGIASRSYTRDDGGLIDGLWKIVPDHLVRYARLGVPSMVWPSAVLGTVPGHALGFATTLCAIVGGFLILRRSTGPIEVDGVGWAAVLAAAAYGVLLWFWPANDGAVLRLATPMAPVVLLVTVVGAGAIASRLWPERGRDLVAGGLTLALIVGLTVSVGFAVQRRGSEPRVGDFVATTRRGVHRSPSGPVLSDAPTLTQVVTGREVIALDANLTGSEVEALAAANRACAIVVTGIAGDGSTRAGAALLRSGRVQRVAMSRDTQVFVLTAPWCR